MKKITLTLEFPECPENFDPLAVIDYVNLKATKKIREDFETPVNWEWDY